MVIPGQSHNNVFPPRKLNETEIVEFRLGERFCGVDVTQVREIIRASGGIVPVPGPHPSIGGVVNLRGKIVPVIDLLAHFHIPDAGDLKKNRIIISEFYRFRVGFRVDHVTRILSMSRLIIEAPFGPLEPWGSYLKGVVHVEDRTLSLLDLEKIALDIHPVDRARPDARAPLPIPAVDFDRATRNILVVEDSAFMRQLLARYLKQAGYNVLTAGNGLEAWGILEDILRSPDFRDIARHYHLILTDVEMPEMDGLALIHKIKGHPALKKLPCIVFSGSLIDDLPGKCQAAGADAQISKDDIERLIRLIDSKVIP